MEKHKCVFAIFGATGDLTHRKLLPALYYMEHEKQLDENFSIICIARKDKSDEEYRKDVSESIKKFSRVKVNDVILEALLKKIHYQRLEFMNTAHYIELKGSIERISGEECHKCERVFYLAVPPSFFDVIVYNMEKTNLAEKNKENAPLTKVVFEKPFGDDLESAKKLNNEIRKVFNESQIYRIDHYLAKELVQNLMVLRFANSIFEPLWNKEYIDHIQITMAETLGVENRGDYYEKAGALRDVVQNHLMQLLTIMALEEPKSLSSDDIRNKKVQVLKSIKLDKGKIKSSVVLGQYSKGIVEEKNVPAYTDEPEVKKDSGTETYAALKLEINNRMWKNVPFYLRTGKRLKDRATEIVIIYKNVPFGLFKNSMIARNMMTIRVQPYEGIILQFNAKVPGSKVIIEDVNMDFCHECKFGPNTPEAYEKLLHDVMLGDQTLFTRWDEVENAWKLIDVIRSSFANSRPCKYEAGSWGPKEADKLIEKDGRKWVEPKTPSYAQLLPKN